MERDDIIEYSLDTHHSEEDGKKIRKKIWFVFWLLLVVTAVEVCLGVWWRDMGASWTVVKLSFIGMTVVKAGYIVLTFMHLGDEVKSLKYTILAPYIVFILYLMGILLTEASFIRDFGMRWF